MFTIWRSENKETLFTQLLSVAASAVLNEKKLKGIRKRNIVRNA